MNAQFENIIIKAEENFTYVALEVEKFSIAEMKSIKPELESLIRTVENDIILDFKQIQYIDSSAMGLLFTTFNYVKTKNRSIALASVAKPILKVFQLTKFDKLLTIYPDLKAARAAYLSR